MEPKIRYNGYTNKWDDVCLNDIVSTAGIKNRENLPLVSFSITNDQGFVPQDDKFENGGTMRDANKSMYYIVSPKTFAYNPARINVGSIGYYDLEKDVIISSLYVVFKTDQEKCDDYYFLQWFKSDKFKRLIEQYQEGGVRLYFFYDKLCKCHVHIPSKEEQHKISSYFRVLDFKLQASAKKLESLKKLKSASLVAMFPQNGESKPKVRFKGFEGEWSKEILGNIAKFSKGQGYSKSDLREDGHPIILYGRMYTKYQFTINNVDTFAYLKEASVFSEGNEIIMPASGETPEDIARASAVLKKGIILGGDLNIMHFDLKKHSTPFIALAITYSNTHYDLSKCAQGKSVVHLHNEAISKATITLPSYEEQQAIASFFRTLNRKIALETARLEKLKQIKLACLDKMFV